MTRKSYKHQAQIARVIAQQITTNEHDRKSVTGQLMTTIMVYIGKMTTFNRGQS